EHSRNQLENSAAGDHQPRGCGHAQERALAPHIRPADKEQTDQDRNGEEERMHRNMAGQKGDVIVEQRRKKAFERESGDLLARGLLYSGELILQEPTWG